MAEETKNLTETTLKSVAVYCIVIRLVDTTEKSIDEVLL